MPESLPGLIFDPAQLERLSQLADVDTSAPVGDWACAAGTVRFVVSEAVWERGDVVVTSSTEANAIPVAEFTLAQILLAGKRSLALESRYRAGRDVRSAGAGVAGTGNYGSVVGLIGAS